MVGFEIGGDQRELVVMRMLARHRAGALITEPAGDIRPFQGTYGYLAFGKARYLNRNILENPMVYPHATVAGVIMTEKDEALGAILRVLP